MLKIIINNEFNRITANPIENNQIEESAERLNELILKLKSINSDLFKNLDEEIGKNISLNSRYFFIKGFEAGLQLANEIKDVKVK